ncbi:alkaline phosphatase [Endozoicomonas numazuensis]|uniref:Alkaline phosphatase n=1 Tax=Endozoicomonas numazuensis TaxID=1137799 RepID=A0A081NK50_9GAMM|nr:alkaline phosphatase [Endozoicomonas numazuensis]KEQ18823.1 alkaline phosphatase [Endozoicomonas numazuensis]
MEKGSLLLAASLGLTLAGATSANSESPEHWVYQGKKALADELRSYPNMRSAKNIILFVGDGMGMSTVTAARILEGQQRGQNGEENELSFEQLPHMSLSKTYTTNFQVPDSAGTMTAMMTGVKTRSGVINLDQSVDRGACDFSESNVLTTFLQTAEDAGQSTGVVSTARLTHATPAATYSVSPDRGWEDDKDMPQEAKNAGCVDIASQLIDFEYGNGIEVAMGGGRRSFIPATMNDPEDTDRTGERQDNRNLTEEWMNNYSNSAYVWNKEQFDNINPQETDHLLGLFNRSHMEYEADREEDTAGEPSIADMTDKAIDILSKNRKGYFLMVEAGRIDHGHHSGNAYRALHDTIAFSNAVKTAMEKTDPRETLIIVTADHSHVMTIAGYPQRGNSILGKVVTTDSQGNPSDNVLLAADGLPYTTLGYANGPGTNGRESSERRVDLNNMDTEARDFRQESLIPLYSETHAGEDVAVYAGGPWAHLFNKTQEQSYVFYVMNHASRINKRKWWNWGQ